MTSKKNPPPAPVLRDEAVDARSFLEGLVGKLAFGATLRAIREGEEESLATFAQKLGVSAQHLSDVEHGRRSVSPERAHTWALALGYSPHIFVELALQDQLDHAGIAMQVNVSPTAPGSGKRGTRARARNKLLDARFEWLSGGKGGARRFAKAAASAPPGRRKKLVKSA